MTRRGKSSARSRRKERAIKATGGQGRSFRLDGEHLLHRATIESKGRRTPPDPLAELGWREWNRYLFPDVFAHPEYADYQIEFWEWLDDIGPDRPTAIECLFPRGGAKSTGGEVGVVKLAARRLRTYFLYVSATSHQAEDHLTSIRELLESERLRLNYPHLANPKIGLHGNRGGYNTTRLWTPGLIVDAVGLEKAKRGAKLGEERPDGMVLDDIDESTDTRETVNRKIDRITRGLGPALTEDAVVMLLNNLVHPGAIVARLIDGTLDMLSGAKRVGPIPAVEGLAYERGENDDGEKVWKITKGRATWSGFNIERAEAMMNLIGEHAFKVECQQERNEVKGALLQRRHIEDGRWSERPPLLRIALGVDPNKTGRADDAGLVVAGVGLVNDQLHGFILADSTQLTDPETWRDEAADLAIRFNVGEIVVEATGIGQHAKLTLQDAERLRNRAIPIEPVEAKQSKADRARPIAQLYKDHRIHHVGFHPTLEDQWCTWVPGRGKSPGAIDAAVHVLTRLFFDEVTGEIWTPGDEYVKEHGGLDWSQRP